MTTQVDLRAPRRNDPKPFMGFTLHTTANLELLVSVEFASTQEDIERTVGQQFPLKMTPLQALELGRSLQKYSFRLLEATLPPEAVASQKAP